MSKFTVFWFRRDLRLQDNAGLYYALRSSQKVLPLFIFDTQILTQLEDKRDKRVQFIYETLKDLKSELMSHGSDLIVKIGQPTEVFKKLVREFSIEKVYTNHDYEPQAEARDMEVAQFLKDHKIEVLTYKDQVIFEKSEILNQSQLPYTVYTPYKKKWLSLVNEFYLKSYPSINNLHHLAKVEGRFPTLEEVGFISEEVSFPTLELNSQLLRKYDKTRDFPYLEKGTSQLGIHLRFGTVSIRELAREAKKFSDVWLSELIWREFYMQVLWHYPKVVETSFRESYDRVEWRYQEDEFERWCQGQTGYPLVDAGMRELNQTGYMHNRVRMVTASFLTKHLLHHWKNGEAYFAKKLLDYDLSANNGNWQWAAGTGCDAAPYFRIFNPESQQKKFDPEFKYIKKWIPEWGTSKYPSPMVDHEKARSRALEAFKKIKFG